MLERNVTKRNILIIKKFRDVYKFRLETLRHTINKPNVDVKEVLEDYKEKLKLEKLEKHLNHESFESETENDNVVKFWNAMKMRHWEALSNEDYMQNCYAPSDAMRNLGPVHKTLEPTIERE